MNQTSVEYLDEWIELYTSGLTPASAADAEHDDITTGLIDAKPLPLWRLREVVGQLKETAATTAVPSPLRLSLSGRDVRRIPGRHGTTFVHTVPAGTDNADA